MQEKSCASIWKGVIPVTLHDEQKKVQCAINHSLSGLQEDPWLAAKILAAAKGEEPVKKKLSAAMVLAVALICVTLSGAIAAALNAWGIISFASRHSDTFVPENAALSITQEHLAAETAHAVCTVCESCYDGKTLRLTANIAPKEKVLLSGNFSLSDNADNLSPALPPDMSIAEYALKHYDGRIAEVALEPQDAETATNDFMLNGDGSATVYIECTYENEKQEREATLSLSYLPLKDTAAKAFLTDPESTDLYDVPRAETADLILSVRAVKNNALVCDQPLDFPSVGVRVNKVALTATPLEIRYTIDYTVTDAKLFAAQDEGLWFEFIDPDSKEKDPSAQRVPAGLTSNGSVERTDGNDGQPVKEGASFRQSDAIGLNALKEEYTLRAYNAWEKTRYEAATFRVTNGK